MGVIRIVGPGKTRGYPYLVCKIKRVDCISIQKSTFSGEATLPFSFLPTLKISVNS